MTTIGWIILLVLLVPALGILAWVVLGDAFVRVPPGRMGLVLVRGRPTARTLLPGVHFIPTIRRVAVEQYPAVEMSYRAGGGPDPSDQQDLDGYGTAVEVFLGDRTRVELGYTLRCRLRPDGLRVVHERFGAGGVMALLRDRSAAVVATALGRPEVGVDDLFGDARQTCQTTVASDLAAALEGDGIELVGFSIRAVDLGRAGDLIQAALRARHELALEHAGATVRRAEAENDADLLAVAPPGSDASWRYREADLWRELVLRRETLNVTLAPGTRVAHPPPEVTPPDLVLPGEPADPHR